MKEPIDAATPAGRMTGTIFTAMAMRKLGIAKSTWYKLAKREQGKK